MERFRRTTYFWAGTFGLIAGATFGWVAIYSILKDSWAPPLFLIAFVLLLLGALFLRRALRLRATSETA